MGEPFGPVRRFLTADEAADYLGGLHPRTLVRWAREGYVPAYPIGEGKRRLWRFLQSDVEAWMLGRRTGSVPLAGVESCLATRAPIRS